MAEVGVEEDVASLTGDSFELLSDRTKTIIQQTLDLSSDRGTKCKSVKARKGKKAKDVIVPSSLGEENCEVNRIKEKLTASVAGPREVGRKEIKVGEDARDSVMKETVQRSVKDDRKEMVTIDRASEEVDIFMKISGLRPKKTKRLLKSKKVKEVVALKELPEEGFNRKEGCKAQKGVIIQTKRVGLRLKQSPPTKEKLKEKELLVPSRYSDLSESSLGFIERVGEKDQRSRRRKVSFKNSMFDKGDTSGVNKKLDQKDVERDKENSKLCASQLEKRRAAVVRSICPKLPRLVANQKKRKKPPQHTKPASASLKRRTKSGCAVSKDLLEEKLSSSQNRTNSSISNSISDINVNCVNNLPLRNNGKIASKLWEVGKKLGVSYDGVDAEVVRKIEELENRDVEGPDRSNFGEKLGGK
ncbi:hypothetical protein RIF29_08983 [Crotalaria pallida]|uniref:Uncharacterized protein n=1 Tax=Crotalaria pallida TaxID=3830 RepID=A0AAN9FRF3_CROPI